MSDHAPPAGDFSNKRFFIILGLIQICVIFDMIREKKLNIMELK